MDEPTAFLEYHEYSRGLEAHFIGEGERPTWLPDSDAVGLHNEIELKADDYAIELARFRHKNGRRITWVGCFTHAVDKVHGNRGNYCGVGVWLVDSFPLYATLIVDGLQGLCKVLRESSDTTHRHSQLNSFRTAYIHQYVRDLKLFPLELPGMEFTASGFSETVYVRVPRRRVDDGFALIGRSIVQLCAAAGQGFTASRVLYLLINDSVVKVPPEKVGDLPATAAGSPDVLDLLLTTYSNYTSSLNSMRLEVAGEKKAAAENAAVIEGYKADKARLESEKAKLENTKLRLESENARLEKEHARLPVPPSNVSNDRPMQNYEARAALHEAVEAQSKKVSDLSRAIGQVKEQLKKRVALPEHFYWITGAAVMLCLLTLVLSITTVVKLGSLEFQAARLENRQEPHTPGGATDDAATQQTPNGPVAAKDSIGDVTPNIKIFTVPTSTARKPQR